MSLGVRGFFEALFVTNRVSGKDKAIGRVRLSVRLFLLYLSK